MKSYYQAMSQDPFQFIPQTYHIKNGEKDGEFLKFKAAFAQYEKQAHEIEKIRSSCKEGAASGPKPHKILNIWIVKPGEATNRGNGIEVMRDLSQIREAVNQRGTHNNGEKKTYIVQKYIERPLLYNKRKFDIRCYMLTTYYNNHLKGTRPRRSPSPSSGRQREPSLRFSGGWQLTGWIARFALLTCMLPRPRSVLVHGRVHQNDVRAVHPQEPGEQVHPPDERRRAEEV